VPLQSLDAWRAEDTLRAIVPLPAGAEMVAESFGTDAWAVVT
jgi:hypothetical protein